MILFSLRHRPLALGVAVALIALRLAWRPSVRGSMTMVGCVTVAGIFAALASVLAIAVRTVWLAMRSARALAAVRRESIFPELAVAGRRAGVRRLVCLAGDSPVAFCAGLFRPSVYLTPATFTALSDEELTAVLVHEQAHARRRDPLRRLLTRAATDVLIYLPLCGWWRERRLEHAELRADREAIQRVGARAVARALMAFDGARPNMPAAAGFEETAQARIDQLLGEETRPQGADRTRASVRGRRGGRVQPVHVRRTGTLDTVTYISGILQESSAHEGLEFGTRQGAADFRAARPR
jgi:Zn-dependent protease with chaperone function